MASGMTLAFCVSDEDEVWSAHPPKANPTIAIVTASTRKRPITGPCYAYSPNLVEGAFSKLRLEGVLRSRRKMARLDNGAVGVSRCKMHLIHGRRQAGMDGRKTKARDAVVPKTPKVPARLPPAVGRAYEEFLELPVALVLVVMWLVGVALEGSGALLMYRAGEVLVRAAAGIP